MEKNPYLLGEKHFKHLNLFVGIPFHISFTLGTFYIDCFTSKI